MSHAIKRQAAFVAFFAVIALSAAAQTSDDAFQPLDIRIDNSTFVPAALDTTPVTVVAIVAGDPVAVVQKKTGRPLTRAEKDAVIAQLKATQSTVRPGIEAKGGKVVGSFQSALNGIKVQIAKNQVNSLLAIPQVVAVKPVGVYEPGNSVSVPFVGAPQVWEGKPPYRGQGVKIAIIDTGVDYTHANFGGPGTVDAFNAAFATNTAPADPALFGDNAPKVKGGIDLVGDNYDARKTDAAHAPVPDPNPLDCNGHGSHTAGTAAGFGVTAAGTTYGGPYNSGIYTPKAFKIGPGVAPMAQLYAVRVFGCVGSTNVVSEAIDWAVDNNMDVISMSLGSSYGVADNSESEAIRNATDAGIIVVASAGNSGPIPYLAGSPANSDGAISVAATDSTATFPAAVLGLPGSTVVAQNSNSATLFTSALPIVVLRNPDNTISLGCNESEYDPAAGGTNVSGKLVVTLRGNCARVFRAGAGQKHGAAAVAMINSSPGYPPMEGDIPGGDPATNPFDPVTIPFLGIQGAPSTDGNVLASAASVNTATASTLPNPGFEMAASFSSGGPRYGDSVLKANITAPGVAVVSTAVGTGTGGVTESGTSMAAPHVAGVAALVKEANRSWDIGDLRAAVVQTAAPTKARDYSPRIEGAGIVQAAAAANTLAVARIADDSVSFGFADLLQDFHGTRNVVVHNNGNKAITFNISATRATGPSSATITVPSSVTVGARSDATVPVTLNVPAAAVGNTAAFRDVGGYIQFKPSTDSANNGVTLTVPYYLVAYSRSKLSTTGTFNPSLPSSVLTVSNAGGVIAGTPSFYSLGLVAPAPQGVIYNDTHAVGVRGTTSGGNRVVVFAVNAFGRFSNPAPNEIDILVYTTSPPSSGTPDYVVIGIDGSFLSSSLPAGRMVSAVLNTHTGNITVNFFATAATDGTTVVLPALASDLGLSTANPRFSYQEQHFAYQTGAGAATPGTASFNAFAPALSFAYAGGALAPGASAAATVTVNPAEWAVTPTRGVMVVAPDNSSTSQAQLIPVSP